MARYLYVFCYQTPDQLAEAKSNGFADEASRALFIEAASPDKALGWGGEIAEEFVRRLFEGGKVSWKAMNYSRWIENDPESEYPSDVLAGLPTVPFGEHPAFEALQG